MNKLCLPLAVLAFSVPLVAQSAAAHADPPYPPHDIFGDALEGPPAKPLIKGPQMAGRPPGGAPTAQLETAPKPVPHTPPPSNSRFNGQYLVKGVPHRYR